MQRKLLTEDGKYIRSFINTGDLLRWLHREGFNIKQSGMLLDGHCVLKLRIESFRETPPPIPASTRRPRH